MSTTPLKLLLVDDDSFLLNMYSLKFSKSNFEVTSAQNGSDALKKLKEGFVPDVILLDIIMPTMDGLELLEAIRKEKLAEKATVIMLTNQSDSSDIEKAKSFGINGYIVKATIIPSEVVQTVVEIHGKHKG